MAFPCLCSAGNQSERAPRSNETNNCRIAFCLCDHWQTRIAFNQGLLFNPDWFSQAWEVLNGVGVDGVGVIFPFFHAFFPFFTHFSPHFTHFSPLRLMDKGKQQQFTAKMGNFTPTPSAPTPCKTSRQARVLAEDMRARMKNTNRD